MERDKTRVHPICVFIPNSKGGEIEAGELAEESDISILETTYITTNSKSQYNDITHNHK